MSWLTTEHKGVSFFDCDSPYMSLLHNCECVSDGFACFSVLKVHVYTVEPRYKEVGYNKTLL